MDGSIHDFKVGDVVRMKSGGPWMTITSAPSSQNDPIRVGCSWFAQDKLETGIFPVQCLERRPTQYTQGQGAAVNNMARFAADVVPMKE